MTRTAAVLLLLVLAACTHKSDPRAAAGAPPGGSGSLGPGTGDTLPVNVPHLGEVAVKPPARDTGPNPDTLAPAGVHGPTDVGTGPVPRDTGTLRRLEARARAIAHAGGCTSAARCRVALVGSRACGGPRAYLPYCAASTDSASLYAALAELKRAEEVHDLSTGAVSTCEYRMPPAVTLRGGRCVADTGQ
jgi:hypothetical protein